MTRRVAISQSNYIPWKGYFDMISHVDEFILLDDVQYTKSDWRNRNRIKTPTGIHWLTIPVRTRGRYLQKIRDASVDGNNWNRKHFNSLVYNYSRAPYFAMYRDWLEDLYLGPQSGWLYEINRHFLEAVCRLLAINTVFSWSWEYKGGADRNERLISICSEAGAGEFVVGPAAKNYIDEARFDQAGISISYFDYSRYAEYPQLYPPFEHQVSILDLVFNTGPDALRHLRRPE